MGLFIATAKGVTFFVDTDTDYASVLVSARGNLSAEEKRGIMMDVEHRIATVSGIKVAIYWKVVRRQQVNFGPSSQGGVPVYNIARIGVELQDYRVRKAGQPPDPGRHPQGHRRTCPA